MKICIDCKLEKSLDMFYKRSDGTPRSYCKECHATRNRKWVENNRERKRENERNQYHRNPQRAKNWKLKRDFGISLEEYHELLEKQYGKCAICKQEETAIHPSGKRKRLAVDHDHDTGRVRGLLCENCNHGIGKFKDSPDRLIEAANYLSNAH